MLQLPAYNNICSIPSDPKKTKHEVLQQKWNHLENFESLKKDVFAITQILCVCECNCWLSGCVASEVTPVVTD